MKPLISRNVTLRSKGFTLIELMVVVLIASILAAVTLPIMRGRINTVRWSEASANAGTVRVAVRTYFAEDPTAAAALAGSNLGVAVTWAALGFMAGDISGMYFVPGDYTITSIDANGDAVINVTSATWSGSGVLNSTGWTYTP